MERFHGLSPEFKPATWYGTCASDGEFIGISFDLADGSIIRLALDADSARATAETLAQSIGQAGIRTNSQSDSSSGSPSIDVSVHNECENVAP